MGLPELASPGCTVAADGSATFVYEDAAATSVHVAGNFNGWGKAETPLERAPGSDLWVARTGPLPPGVHQYKYVVGERWTLDPAHPLDTDDGLGGRNSAFVVGLRDLGSPRSIRVLSLNLHTYQERNAKREDDSLRKLEQVAFGAAAGGADILLLQEVGEHVSSPVHPNAGAVLQRHLERLTRRRWHHEWREAHIGFDVYREGLSILSASPLEDLAVLPLREGPAARIALVATITAKGTKLRVVTAHTSWPDEGHAEVKQLVDLLRQRTVGDHAATLVAGDFNSAPHEPQAALLVSNGYVDVAAAKGSALPTFGHGDGASERPLDRRIDYHFLRTTAGRGAPRLDRCLRVFDGAGPEDGLHPRVSDHAGIFAAYSWEPRQPGEGPTSGRS
jgi:maltose 6'-phosphate phosphatase